MAMSGAPKSPKLTDKILSIGDPELVTLAMKVIKELEKWSRLELSRPKPLHWKYKNGVGGGTTALSGLLLSKLYSELC